MEPFNLSLQQVNLEEKDITEYDTLDSFSNLVSFDSEFSSSKSDALPVIGRSIPFLKPREQKSAKVKYSSPYDSGEEVFPTKHHMVGSITSHTNYSRRHGDTMAMDPSGDSFVGFTDTVQALALQKSVIGNMSVKPASEDEVARAIAEARQKIQVTGDRLLDSFAIPSVDPTRDNQHAVPIHETESTNDVTTHPENVMSEYRMQKSKIQPNIQNVDTSIERSSSYSDANSSVEYQHRDSESISSISSAELSMATAGEHLDSLMNASSVSVQSAASGQSDSLLFVSENGAIDGEHTKELIPIPGDQLTKQVERTSTGWFSRKDQKQIHKDNKGKRKKSHEKQTFAESVSASSSPKRSVDGVESAASQGADHQNQPRLSPDNSQSTDVESTASSPVTDHAVDHEQTPAQSPTHILQTDTSASTTETTTIKQDVYTEDTRTTQVTETRHITDEKSLTVTREVNIIKETPEPLPASVTSHLGSPSKYRRDAQDGDSLRAELDKVLREKAKLEGQIEVLQEESSTVIKERAQLQAQVATLQQQTRSAEVSASSIKSERDDLTADMETLRLNRSRLEQVIMDARKLMEDKDQDMRTLAEDLKLSHEANIKLQNKIKESKVQLMNKDAMTQDFKGKIAELYVDFQMSNQNKLLAESEIKSLQSEIKSLAVAKQWYQEQLQVSQEAKGVLQKEVSSVKSEMIAQTTMVERLKADNIYIKQQLAEAEQRALSEKEKLALHLEAIESHMMEREVTFAQLQQQKDSIEATLQQRLGAAEPVMSVEVAEELRKAENELRRRQAHISIMEHEQADLVRRLTLSQESILERDKNIDALGRKSVETEVHLQQVQLVVREREEEIHQLKDDKSRIEVEAAALKAEQETTSSALETLKSDMGKVESRFKQLKQELKTKQVDIDELKSENNQLLHKLEESEKAVDVARVHGNLIQESLQNTAATTPDDLTEGDNSELSELQKNVAVLQTRDTELVRRLEAVRSESSLLIDELKQEKVTLEQKVQQLTELLEKCQEVETGTEQSVEPRSDVKELLQGLEASHKQLIDWGSQTEAERETHVDQLQNQQLCIEAFLSGSSNLNIHEMTLVLQTIISQNQTIIRVMHENQQHKDSSLLEESLMNQESEHKNEMEQLQSKLHSIGEENDLLRRKQHEVTLDTDSQITTLRSQLAEKDQLYEQVCVTVAQLEKQLKGVQLERDSLEEQLAQKSGVSDVTSAIQQQNSDLRSRLATVETESHKEIAKQKAMALKLGKDLEGVLKASREQKHVYNTTVAEYENKLASSLEYTTQLTAQLLDAQNKFSLDLDEKTVHLQHELHDVRIQYEERTRTEVELREVIHQHEVDMSKYLSRIEELQMNLTGAEEMIQRYQEQEEDTSKLLLDLEREKGRLAGALQNHTALKEHTSSLEVALAQHESSTVQANSQITTELDRAHKEISQLTEQLEQYQQSMENEKQSNKDLKKQLLTEKGGHVKVRRHLESLILEHDQLKLDVDGQKQAVLSLTDELNKVRESDSKHRAELEHLSQEVRLHREDRDKYYPELEARRNTEPIVQEQIQSLEWQVTERDTEISALKEQLLVVDQRQQLETNTLSSSLQAVKKNMSELREELMSIKLERTRLQTRIAELKGALQASLQHTKLLQQNREDHNIGMNFDLDSLENLLKEQTTTTISSKPLSFLQATLSNLRGEIGDLQSQVDVHAHAVQTTSMAWKELEAQVRDLREVCKTSAADREASQKLVLESIKLAENPPPTPPTSTTPPTAEPTST